MSRKIGVGKSYVIGKQACFITKSWFGHLIKLKAQKHMQNLRANLKSNYLLGIILKVNYFLPSNNAYSAFPRSLKWTETIFHHNNGITKFNQHTKFSGFVPNANCKRFLVLLKENDVTFNETWVNETYCSDDEFKNIF